MVDFKFSTPLPSEASSFISVFNC